LDTTRPHPAIDEPPEEPDASPGTNLYRSPARVGILAFIGFVLYPLWWRWQLFEFTRRQGFPRAKSFWWTLVPFYGFVVIWEQLDDLKHAAASKKIRVPAALIIALLIGGTIALGITRWRDASPRLLLALLFLSSLLTALGIYLGQRSIVAFLAATYPTERRRRVSMGEIVATILAVVTFASSSGLVR
jgi:uncharacterized membrane protein YhaH (DUF805 family)